MVVDAQAADALGSIGLEQAAVVPGDDAVPRAQVRRIHASSGTTGKPTVVGYTERDLDTWGTVVARSMRAAGTRPGDMVHVAYGYGLFTGGLGFLLLVIASQLDFGYPPMRVGQKILDVAGTEIGAANLVTSVLLAGSLAYKIKKPLDLGFLDFVTLASREQACRSTRSMLIQSTQAHWSIFSAMILGRRCWEQMLCVTESTYLVIRCGAW